MLLKPLIKTVTAISVSLAVLAVTVSVKALNKESNKSKENK